MKDRLKVLFVYSRNQWRSPTPSLTVFTNGNNTQSNCEALEDLSLGVSLW